MGESDRSHLRRLDRVFSRHPVYFITTCVRNRASILASERFHEIAKEVWKSGQKHHDWSVGSYVIMPDHVHFFCQANSEHSVSLSKFVGGWKEWTAKKAARNLSLPTPLWQREFFDHVLRSDESLAEKVEYLRQNPVRANLSKSPEDWEFCGQMAEW